MARDPVAEIIRYNRRFLDRYPALLRQKIERMAGDSFGFFRGAFHLFARDLIQGALDPWQNENPFTRVETRLVGDIHSENYGTYKAQDGTLRYDINDFDETTSGSFDFDCKRAAASLFLAAAQDGLPWSAAVQHVEAFVRAYVHAIEKLAVSPALERFSYGDQHLPDAAAVNKLIAEARDRPRKEFIDKLTIVRAKRREILRTLKYFELRPADRERAARLFADYVRRRGEAQGRNPGHYEALDICGRVAGCGSLGRFRYAVLIAGDGSEHSKNVLLEIKESLPSAYDECRGREQGADDRRNRAAEVIQVQCAMQTASNEYLGYAVDGEASFQVKEIGPHDAKLDWKQLKKPEDVQAVARLYGEILAKCHARADSVDGRPGQARLDIAAALEGQVEPFVKRVTAFALGYSELVEDDQRRFVARRLEVERELLGAS